MSKFLIVIIGPTAVGKTKLSIQIAKKLRTEIISADSRQFYKELSIGTAVPSKNELNEIKHHFIQTKSIHDYYNARKFESDVIRLLETLFINKDYVVMTGGSGLYINAVCNGIDDIPSVDKVVREDLLNKLNNEGIESIRQQLKLLDPEYYKRVDLKNPKRILKALEISIISGKPYSSFLTKEKKGRPFKTIKIGLNLNRDLLYQRINKRVDTMLKYGLIDEAKKVYPFRKNNSLNTVGYKELFEYFDGNIPLEEAIRLIKRNTRRYARKQLTWFNKDNEIKWFNPNDMKSIMNYIKSSNGKN